MIFYFTGTGNSLYVAKKIGGNLVSISQANKKKNQRYQDDVIGFVCPTYAVGIPRIVQEFLSDNQFQADYSFAIMTCGGTLGSSLMQFEILAASSGLKLDYTNKIIMVDNYGVKHMRKKLKRFVPLKEDAVIERIAFDISEKRHLLQRSNFFIIGYTKLMNTCSGLCYDGADRHFTIQTDRCVKCGLCEKICPAENIRIDSFPVFKHKCEGCYACIHACPQRAISPGRFSVETQYRHPGITLHELLPQH